MLCIFTSIWCSDSFRSVYFSLLLWFGLLVSFCFLGIQVNLYGNIQTESAQITITQLNRFLHSKHTLVWSATTWRIGTLATPQKPTLGPHQHRSPHRLQGQRGYKPTSKDIHLFSDTTQPLHMSLDERIHVYLWGSFSEWCIQHSHTGPSLLPKECNNSPCSPATY